MSTTTVNENMETLTLSFNEDKEVVCDVNKEEIDVVFTKKEIENYNRQKDKTVFKNPTDEYLWAKTQFKNCTKCLKEKRLCDFNGNTSGTDAFDKNGYRLRRPECSECTKNVSKGKTEAKKRAKELGISYVAPEGTLCAVCKKPPTSSNGLVFDHCHTNNVFRGYCCNSCNRSIGVLGDNVDGILQVLNYLLKTEKCNIVQNENGELVKV
jgi:hypothetical protein